MKVLRCLKLVKEGQGWMWWSDLFEWKESRFMEKPQKLGQIGEMLWISWEIYEKWAGTSCSMEGWWAEKSCKRSTHLLYQNWLKKELKIDFCLTWPNFWPTNRKMLNSTLWTEKHAREIWKKNMKWSKQMNLNQYQLFQITLAVAWKSKNCVFGWSSSALTSNHGPKKGERRSRPAVGLFGSSSITVATYLKNLKQKQIY